MSIACMKWNDPFWEERAASEICEEFEISHFQVSCAKEPSRLQQRSVGSTHKVIEAVT